MKKIMFSERYGLEQAVLAGTKTQTRRIIPTDLYNQTDWKAVAEGDFEALVDGEGYYHDIRNCGKYRVGEEVAIAQSYKNLIEQGYLCRESDGWVSEKYCTSPGYRNKMFVKAEYMPHRIRITGIKVERLQDISEADIMQEGIMKGEFMNTWDRYYYDTWGDVPNHITFRNPQLAYASLIDSVCGRGTWDSNPWVVAYSFYLQRAHSFQNSYKRKL